MSSVKGRGNKTTELRLRLALVRNGISGWHLHPKGVAGVPDFFFPKEKVAVFVDGCFWHGCPRCGHLPKNNSEFWKEKINRTKIRDKRQASDLKRSGIVVIRFWEHDLANQLDRCLMKIQKVVFAV
jgi:DNA mismatch endonuclease (patch repair protein)